MQNGVEKVCEQARRQRAREEKRRRKNERRLEGQRREFERNCEALRKRQAAAGGEGDAARVNNGRDEGGACANWVGRGEGEPQPLREEAARTDDGQRKRSGKPERRNDRRAMAGVEADAGTKTPAGRVASPLAPAKNEHPGLHVMMIAQLTPLAPSSPPITPCGEASSRSGKGETCRQEEDCRTSLEADYLFDPPRRCTSLAPAASAPPLAVAVAESPQTCEAVADVLFFEPQLPHVERPRGSDSTGTVAAIVPIVKIGRASAAFYRNSGEPASGDTRQPQKLSRGRGRGGWHGQGGRAPRGELAWTNWG